MAKTQLCTHVSSLLGRAFGAKHSQGKDGITPNHPAQQGLQGEGLVRGGPAPPCSRHPELSTTQAALTEEWLEPKSS